MLFQCLIDKKYVGGCLESQESESNRVFPDDHIVISGMFLSCSFFYVLLSNLVVAVPEKLCNTLDLSSLDCSPVCVFQLELWLLTTITESGQNNKNTLHHKNLAKWLFVRVKML